MSAKIAKERLEKILRPISSHVLAAKMLQTAEAPLPQRLFNTRRRYLLKRIGIRSQRSCGAVVKGLDGFES